MVAPGGMHGCSGGGHTWDMTRYGDTVNERAVRILLECILVTTYFHSCFQCSPQDRSTDSSALFRNKFLHYDKGCYCYMVSRLQ